MTIQALTPEKVKTKMRFAGFLTPPFGGGLEWLTTCPLVEGRLRRPKLPRMSGFAIVCEGGKKMIDLLVKYKKEKTFLGGAGFVKLIKEIQKEISGLKFSKTTKNCFGAKFWGTDKCTISLDERGIWVSTNARFAPYANYLAKYFSQKLELPVHDPMSGQIVEPEEIDVSLDELKKDHDELIGPNFKSRSRVYLSDQKTIEVTLLEQAISGGLSQIWPDRLVFKKFPLGESGEETNRIQYELREPNNRRPVQVRSFVPAQANPERRYQLQVMITERTEKGKDKPEMALFKAGEKFLKDLEKKLGFRFSSKK